MWPTDCHCYGSPAGTARLQSIKILKYIASIIYGCYSFFNHVQYCVSVAMVRHVVELKHLQREITDMELAVAWDLVNIQLKSKSVPAGTGRSGKGSTCTWRWKLQSWGQGRFRCRQPCRSKGNLTNALRSQMWQAQHCKTADLMNKKGFSVEFWFLGVLTATESECNVLAFNFPWMFEFGVYVL